MTVKLHLDSQNILFQKIDRGFLPLGSVGYALSFHRIEHLVWALPGVFFGDSVPPQSWGSYSLKATLQELKVRHLEPPYERDRIKWKKIPRHIFCLNETIYLVFRTSLRAMSPSGRESYGKHSFKADVSLRAISVAHDALQFLLYQEKTHTYQFVERGCEEKKIRVTEIPLSGNEPFVSGPLKLATVAHNFFILGTGQKGPLLLSYDSEKRKLECFDLTHSEGIFNAWSCLNPNLLSKQ